MEDIRIGRKTNSSERLVALPANTDTIIAGPNENRIALIVVNVNINVLGVSSNPMTAQNQGIKVASAQINPLVMKLETYGNLVTMPLHAFADTAANCIVIEVFLNDK